MAAWGWIAIFTSMFIAIWGGTYAGQRKKMKDKARNGNR
jgi:cbb3-type cytochrome oxidase subunit 3